MRKIYLFLLALCVSSVSSLVTAQRYPISFDVNQKITHESRYIIGVSLQPKSGSTNYGQKQEITVNEGITSGNKGNYPAYNDVTSASFAVKAGQTLQPLFMLNTSVWDGKWMHSYVYVDENLDNELTTSSPDELKVYTQGKDEGNHWVNHISTFRAPTSSGAFSMRYKIDWSNTDPRGSSVAGEGIIKNGGCITDVTMNVVYPKITFLVNDNTKGTVEGATENQVCGEDYTFTVRPKRGYDATVTATVGDGTVNVEVMPTNNGDGTYTVAADKFQNDMTISVTFVEHTPATAADAAAGNCYFRLLNRNYAGRYLKAAIAKVPDGNTTNRVTNNTATLFTHTLEASSASYIWKLQPIAGTNKFYLTSQGYMMGSIGNGDNQTVRMSTETGSQVTVGTVSGYYTFTTGAGNNGYLHALRFGETDKSDSTYPATDEGNYVASWNTSENPSQWTIEPVEEFNITIGKGGWSTIKYAFPVSLPASVVKAYAVSGETESTVSLAEVEPVDGEIQLPSNTPVFLEGAEGAVCTVFILTFEPSAISVTNELSGTLLPESPTGTIYGIATPDGKPTALYKMQSDTTIPCNKAYLASTQSGVAKLDLDFGGTTTGIDSLTPDPTTVDSNVLYDLNGRRVLYPTRGIYVTGSGKKIYLK